MVRFDLVPANLNIVVFVRSTEADWPVIEEVVVVFDGSFANQRGYFTTKERGIVM